MDVSDVKTLLQIAENDTIKVTVDDSNVGIMGYAVEKNNHYLVKVKADPTGGE